MFAHVEGLEIKVTNRDTRHISNQVTKESQYFIKKNKKRLPVEEGCVYFNNTKTWSSTDASYKRGGLFQLFLKKLHIPAALECTTAQQQVSRRCNTTSPRSRRIKLYVEEEIDLTEVIKDTRVKERKR